jgi:PAS domain S-box-containing protein
MPTHARERSFLRSKSGQGMVAYLIFSLVVAVAVGWGFYSATLGWYAAHKTEEKTAALTLADAFVKTYADAGAALGANAPTPSSFRADAIARFGKTGPAALVALPTHAAGSSVIVAPPDPEIAETLLQAFALGASLVLVLGGAGLTAALVHHRQALAREEAQESLRYSEARLRDFAATASDWFWEQDEDLRFIFISSGAPDIQLNVIGRTRRDIATSGKSFGLTAAVLAAHEADCAARRPFQNLRYQRIASDGELHHISVSGRPVFDSDGNFRGYRGTGRDVTTEVAAEMELSRRVEERTTELRMAQIELVRREKLSTLGQLTATVAHELRNPLSAIRNTVFTVRETLAKSGINLERPLSRVERNIQRCDRIIADLLDFTRIRDLNRAELEPDAWLDDVLNDQRMLDGVVLKRDFGAAQRRVSIDPERMRRVIVNLVENAAQALAETNPPECAITVRTRASAGIFELAVADTGPGIPADVLPKVFEPLFSTKSFGTGLGLPTVKQIVEQHGGTVEISSKRGHGTEVVVRLPSLIAEEMAA